jgi:phosphatidylglycerophosphate synthase
VKEWGNDLEFPKTAMRKYISVPNALSALRLLMFPFLLYFAYSGQREYFAWLFLASLISDLLDGFIARRFNMVTEFGSKLDSWGDLCNYIAALYGIMSLYWADVANHATGFSILFGLYFIGMFVMLIKFRRLIGMHLYMSKATGYVHGFFLLTWFLFGFNNMIYYSALLVGIYTFTEELILVLLLRKPDHDLKGLYWVVRDRKDLWKKE